MRILIYIVLLCLSGPAMAQNIVPNPDFSATTACPAYLGDIHKCTGWYRPTSGSSDYMNGCNTADVGVPANMYGIQDNRAHAYAGIYTYYGTADYREYIATHIPPMVPGAVYRVTVRVSVAEQAHVATDGFGVWFTKDARPDSAGFDRVIPVIPQVRYTSYGVVRAKSVWTTMTTEYVPDSAYTGLIFGCFLNNAAITAETDTPGTMFPQEVGYYYVDSVAVERIWRNGVGIADAEQDMVHSYPTPFHDAVHIILTTGTPQHFIFRLYNAAGSVVRTIEGLDTNIVMPREELPTGLYYYSIYYDDGLTSRGVLTAD